MRASSLLIMHDIYGTLALAKLEETGICAETGELCTRFSGPTHTPTLSLHSCDMALHLHVAADDEMEWSMTNT